MRHSPNQELKIACIREETRKRRRNSLASASYLSMGSGAPTLRKMRVFCQRVPMPWMDYDSRTETSKSSMRALAGAKEQ